MIQLRAQDVDIAYGETQALTGVNFDLTASVIAVVGHNGSGKSTLIKGLLGLLVPKRGRLEVLSDGERVQPDEGMAFCPEEGSVFKDISVEQYIQLWCRLKHHDGRYYLGEGARFIELLSIEELLKRKGSELSKGQKRRVQMCVGFIAEPDLLLFDEPFDGLDVQQTSHLESIIARESQKHAFLLSSHRMPVVERVADYVIVLDRGKICAQGQPTEVAETLAGRSFLFSLDRDRDSDLDGISKKLPNVVAHRIGVEVCLTGKGLSQDKVRSALRELSLVGEDDTVLESSPPLAEAMSYHLQNRSLSES